MRSKIERRALNITRRRFALANEYNKMTQAEREEMDKQLTQTLMFASLVLNLSLAEIGKTITKDVLRIFGKKGSVAK